MSSVVSEIRRKNLLFLVEQYSSIASLNQVLGRARNDSTFSQIINRVKINGAKGEGGGKRAMGTALARTIEEKLNLPRGWMDEIHEEILPEQFEAIREVNTVSFSDLPKVVSIPLYIQSSTEINNSKSTLSGEIQLPNFFIDSVIHEYKYNLEGYLPTDSAMYKTLPQNSIILVNRVVSSFVGDGLYLVIINNLKRFKRISQLLDSSFVIESDINKENSPDLSTLTILGKVTNIWINQKV